MYTVTLYKEMQNFDREKTEASMASFDPDIWARYLLRELYDLGYNTAALALEKEACVSVDSEAMSQIRTSLHNFKWDQALHSLDSLRMRDPAALQEAKRTIAIGKYLYFLSKQESLQEAVIALHNDIVPLYSNTAVRKVRSEPERFEFNCKIGSRRATNSSYAIIMR